MKRRDFLKLLGLAGAGMSASCLETYHWLATGSRRLTSYLAPPDENSIPGEAVYYPSTCSECPANCGILVKVREGNAIKLEGNSEHPLNTGGMCIRGQAALNRLYHPNRLRTPLMRNDKGQLTPATWDAAYAKILQALPADDEQRQNFYLSGKTTGTLAQVAQVFCKKMGITRLPEYEPYSHAALRDAYLRVVDQADIPFYAIAESDFLLTIGADILDTFVNPVAYGKQFAMAKAKADWQWVHVEPHISLTGLKAHKRLITLPGSEIYLVRWLCSNLSAEQQKKLPAEILLKIQISLADASQKTGLTKEVLQHLAKSLLQAKQPLLIAGGIVLLQPTGLEIGVLTALYQWASGMIPQIIDFSQAEKYASVGNLNHMQQLSDNLAAGKVGTIFLADTDPVAHMPASSNFATNLAKAKMRIGLGDFLTATNEQCDIVLPLSHSIESLGDAAPRTNLHNLIQPAIQPLYDTKQTGDILLQLMKQYLTQDPAPLPNTYEEYLYDRWAEIGKQDKGFLQADFLKKGYHQRLPFSEKVALKTKEITNFFIEEAKLSPEPFAGMTVVITPSLKVFDGRSDILPLLAEIPEPLTTVTHAQCVSMAANTAKDLQVEDGDVINISLGNDKIQLPTKVQPLLAENVLVAQYGAQIALQLPNDTRCGQTTAYLADVAVQKNGKSIKLPILSGSMLQTHRGITEAYHHHIHHHGPKSLYPEHEHPDYRWAMAIDLELCTGCSACVAACYIENNIPITGKKEHLRGRELSWLRIEPYLTEREDNIAFVPVMCQHCANAPCEPVCPVYAANHSQEGLNVQVYSRCVGTRYCANNCPYKVRRFNWFDYDLPSPMDKMINPDVMRRSKGIMEKCTFCVQRIRVAKDKAKDAKRKVDDGEVIPACAQTCPTNAIVFGNILDKNSQIYRLAHSKRAYRIHEHIGVEPAVYYLGKGGDKA